MKIKNEKLFEYFFTFSIFIFLFKGAVRKFNVRCSSRRRSRDDCETHAASFARLHARGPGFADLTEPHHGSTVYRSAFIVASSCRWSSRLRRRRRRFRLPERRRGAARRRHERRQQNPFGSVRWIHV